MKISKMKININTKNNIEKLYRIVGTEKIFGRKDISELCDISYSAAGSLIGKLKKNGLIRAVKGHGKGKYSFFI